MFESIAGVLFAALVLSVVVIVAAVLAEGRGILIAKVALREAPRPEFDSEVTRASDWNLVGDVAEIDPAVNGRATSATREPVLVA